MSNQRTRVLSICAASAGLAALFTSAPALASGFATPPPSASRMYVTVDEDGDRYTTRTQAYEVEPRSSLVRLLVGPAGKLSPDSISPGMLVAVDVGRGPTGFRLSGAWLDVGSEKGLAQYTGELTIDFGRGSRVRPVIGAGGGIARTSSSVREDGTTDPDKGASIGVGVVRAGLGLRLPFDDADARVTLDVTGSFPAIHGREAPELSPWVLTSLTVGIGF